MMNISLVNRKKSSWLSLCLLAFTILLLSAFALTACDSKAKPANCPEVAKWRDGICVCPKGTTYEEPNCVIASGKPAGITVNKNVQKPAASNHDKAKSISGSVETTNAANKTVKYNAYIPPTTPGNLLPVVVVLGGLNSDGANFIAGKFESYAKKYGYALIAPSFKYSATDWASKSSYQFPEAWSGDALDKIIGKVATTEAIDTDSIYLFGFSAGAQFAHRYALQNSSTSRAVAAHAAGGYTLPEYSVDAKFLITVGTQDTKRLKQAEQFVKSARSVGITTRFNEVTGIGHRLTDKQVKISFDFFNKVRGQ